jgi:hypothetical protein
VLDRHLHHLRPTPQHAQKQSQNLTKHYSDRKEMGTRGQQFRVRFGQACCGQR